MCLVSINIDEVTLQQLEYEDNEAMSIEEARAMTLTAVREEYA